MDMVAGSLTAVRPADLLELTKARIVSLVLVTVAAGFVVANPAHVDGVLLLHTLLGTTLVAAGTNALNQVMERDIDARMQRTRQRPLPAGRMAAGPAAVGAWSAGALGVAYLAVMANPTTGFLGAATLLSYVFVYTPLKRTTSLATLVGAIPGALPIVGGWTAAGGVLDGQALALFAILFLWQLPHFLALAWLYREDYARAGLPMLSVEDGTGALTFRQASLYAAALVPVSLMPTLIGLAGRAYFWGATVLSLWMLWATLHAFRQVSADRARRVFRTSVIYLPGVLTLLVLDGVV